MRTIVLLLLLLLFPTVQTVAAPAGIDPLFNGIQFGDPPGDNMLCTAGPCTVGRISSGHRHPNQIVSVYKMPLAATQLDGVEISAAEYSFFSNRLFRIGFKVLCPPDRAEICMNRLADTLTERYGMTRINQIFDSARPGQAIMQQNFLTADGDRIEFCLYQENGQWMQPYVSFFRPELMDAVRLTANPKYRPNVN